MKIKQRKVLFCDTHGRAFKEYDEHGHKACPECLRLWKNTMKSILNKFRISEGLSPKEYE